MMMIMTDSNDNDITLKGHLAHLRRRVGHQHRPLQRPRPRRILHQGRHLLLQGNDNDDNKNDDDNNEYNDNDDNNNNDNNSD